MERLDISNRTEERSLYIWFHVHFYIFLVFEPYGWCAHGSVRARENRHGEGWWLELWNGGIGKNWGNILIGWLWLEGNKKLWKTYGVTFLKLSILLNFYRNLKLQIFFTHDPLVKCIRLSSLILWYKIIRVNTRNFLHVLVSKATERT